MLTPKTPHHQQNCASQQFTGGSYAGCGTDPKCICSNAAFISTISCCVAGVCDAADQAAAITFAQQICQANGVAVPTAVTCASSAASTGTAAASSGSATTGTAASATSRVSGAPSSSASSTAASAAWAPKRTAAPIVEMLGLAAAGLALL